jgi:hypothetical protein
MHYEVFIKKKIHDKVTNFANNLCGDIISTKKK